MTLAMHYPADIIYSAIIAGILIFSSNKLVESLQTQVVQPIGSFIFRRFFG
jgi:hypothetical protein